jgi:hypothetical protein
MHVPPPKTYLGQFLLVDDFAGAQQHLGGLGALGGRGQLEVALLLQPVGELDGGGELREGNKRSIPT